MRLVHWCVTLAFVAAFSIALLALKCNLRAIATMCRALSPEAPREAVSLRQCVSQSASQSVSQPANQPGRQSASQPASQSVSQPLARSWGNLGGRVHLQCLSDTE